MDQWSESIQSAGVALSESEHTRSPSTSEQWARRHDALVASARELFADLDSRRAREGGDPGPRGSDEAVDR